MTTSWHSEVSPLDEHNTTLLERVRPSDWKNPAPAPLYDLVVVGAGTGGLICAAVGAGLGAKVALVERNLMGGDCLNYGCVPSKAVIRHARRVADAREVLGKAGLDDVLLDREFARAMERMRAIRADISRDDSAKRYRDELGVDVFQGNAQFTGKDAVEVAGVALRFRKAVIASGARAAVPAIPGLAESGYVTNETVFNLTQRPRRLAVIGGGPIGCELAQAMRRLGCDVTLLHMEEQLLHREDADAARIVQERFVAEGVRLVLGAQVLSVSPSDGASVVRYRAAGLEGEATCDLVLVAAGRRPNVEGMGLEAAGVAFDAKGIGVDDNLRTSNPRVFAVGDCCLRWQFTHAADAAAKIAVQNALFFGRKKLSALVMPWCTFTDPEIAHVGMYEHEAKAAGMETETFTVAMEKVNRAVCDGESEGFVRVHVKKGSDRILGATIVASHAGEMISEVSLAIGGGLGLAKIAGVIHPYPTQAEGIKAAANAYMRTKLTPLAKKFLGLLLRLQR
ncbi:MAG: mercuric reductase [Candidatus Binatia bacterium]